MNHKTTQAKVGEHGGDWYVVDASSQVLGRLAVNIARVLRGKHRPEYTPHIATGDHVIVINADRLDVTGKKQTDKLYRRYSGYPGGLRQRTYVEAVKRDATFPLRHAVRGMLQHNTLGADQLKRLRVYAGKDHNHRAQKPRLITFGELGEIVVASNATD